MLVRWEDFPMKTESVSLYDKVRTVDLALEVGGLWSRRGRKGGGGGGDRRFVKGHLEQTVTFSALKQRTLSRMRSVSGCCALIST